ncbi:hypothetical protein KPH14_005689 [Odynerus spinipes]|uniref:SEC14-like protein 2 n=1 Tax=Odynerus spinipes TaxID=1348599 RepID=A0AAD9RAU3_9HYME|nr:hypothetical protein KPH14_005689 [Odynerus spinipes]
MSTSLNLLDNQRFALMKFRRLVNDVTQPHHDDRFLLRWLRARNWNPEAAEKMLRSSLEWRKQWDADKIEKWNQPQVLHDYLPHGLSGFDKDGAPVVIIPFAGFDVYGILHAVSRRDVIMSLIKNLENYLNLCNEQAKKHGPLAGQVTVIFDMEGFNLKQYMWRPAGEVIINMLQMYEANYPEILKMCYIINAPKMFAFAFAIAKKFMDAYTLSKIQIFKADPPKWKSAILELIPRDQLPAHFGGTLTDTDGNPKLASKICQGGKVPKEFYTAEMDKDNPTEYTAVTVRKGDKLELNVTTSEEGSLLSWDFRTDGYDIKFGILKNDTSGTKTEIVPIKKVTAHQLNEIGIVTCDMPATYSVVFDNSYSLVRNKKIHYSIRVIPPSEEVKDLTP